MATTTPQANRLRADLAQLTDIAFDDLGVLWRQFNTADEAQAGLQDVLPQLVAVYGSAAASLAADWYDDLREEQGVPGRFGAVVADLPDELGTTALAGYAAGSLYRPVPDWDAALTLTRGGMQRRIANMARGTITGSAIADPSAKGWQRVGVGACKQGFCDMLIARGAVYSEATADFASHDHCKCSAQPAWGGREIPVKPYTPSLRNISDADRARLRKYLRTH